jgi:HSP20 family molecular chaperone IbpA
VTKNRKTSFQDIGEELDRRLGGLLGEVGTSLGEVLGRLEEISDGEIVRERDFGTRNGPVRAGIRVRVGGIGGAARAHDDDIVTAFGDLSDAPGGPDQTTTRPDQNLRNDGMSGAARPIEATIFIVDGTWTLIADLPGVEPGDVTLGDDECGGTLTVSAKGRGRQYAGSFDLPDGVSASDLRLSLLNGIMELSASVDLK